MDLKNVHTLFNCEDPLDNNSNFNDYTDLKSHSVNVDVYPLELLCVVGNVQVTGISQCFYCALTEISQSVHKNTNGVRLAQVLSLKLCVLITLAIHHSLATCLSHIYLSALFLSFILSPLSLPMSPFLTFSPYYLSALS